MLRTKGFHQPKLPFNRNEKRNIKSVNVKIFLFRSVFSPLCLLMQQNQSPEGFEVFLHLLKSIWMITALQK